MFKIIGYSNEELKKIVLCKYRDLLRVIIADGIIQDSEKEYVLQIMFKEKFLDTIMRAENVPYEQLRNTLSKIDIDLIEDAYYLYQSEDERLKHLSQMVYAMMIDGSCDESEIKYCNEVAKKLGFEENIVGDFFGRITVEMMKENKKLPYMNMFIDFVANGGKLPEKK